MILNGKSEVDFIKWASYNYGEDSGDLTMLREVYRNALIIEFFDSVGIYIEIHYSRILGDKFLCIVNTEANYNLTSYQDSRQQATEQAIIKANEIHNARTN